MAATPGGDTLVLGVGNELYRDEGVGVVVAREVAALGTPPGVRGVEGAVGGLNLLFDMEAAARVIIVDAVDMGLEPGAWRVFTPDDVHIAQMSRVASLHQIGLEHILEQGQVVGICPAVQIVGVQPAEVAPGFGLTDTVARMVPEAVRAVRQLLTGPGPSAGDERQGGH